MQEKVIAKSNRSVHDFAKPFFYLSQKNGKANFNLTIQYLAVLIKEDNIK